MKNKQVINNIDFIKLLNQYNIKCKKTVYTGGMLVYYLTKAPEKKLINILINNYSNYVNYNNTGVPVITIL